MIRASSFPSTDSALAQLAAFGASSRFYEYTLEHDDAHLRLVTRKRGEIVVELPRERLREITVAETQSSVLHPVWALAIIITVDRERGDVALPIVPLSADGKRQLTWNDDKVWQLASELSEQLGVPLVGRSRP